MKTLFKNIVLFLALSIFASCSGGDEDFTPETLEVTPNNISGYWELTEYNGMLIPEGTYCYIEYIRKDRKFVMYQNFDSMYPRAITGVFSIENDRKKGYILDGKYDYGMGEWNNKYIVTELLAGSMILTADSETAEICKYVRCNEIPEDVLNAAK